MQRSKTLLINWLPVLLWVALIFGASTDALSANRTSRLIGPVLRWLNPGISDTTIKQVQLVVRKGAHVTEYAILALLLYRALQRSMNVDAATWCRTCAIAAWTFAVLYAASDEWHQTFVPSRGGSFNDVIIDSCGAALGLLLWQHRLFLKNTRGLRKRV